jgi:uncharacterized 2Fe-2S/4Fe-4S cluster protein (DUF4445 family)
MVRVCFLPEEKTVDVMEGVTILEAARLAAVVIESPCGGTGVCGKCKVRLTGSSPDNQDTHAYCLACQTEIFDNVTVQKTENNGLESTKVLEGGEGLSFSLSPFVRKKYDEMEERTLVCAGEKTVAIEKGDTRNTVFGVVVDIGTTTLAAGLVDLVKGTEVASISSLNPQSLHAQDVLSRIKLSSEEEGLKLMHTALTDELNRMIREMTEKNGISSDSIYEIVYSGNTCMLHLATATTPYTLGRYPYVPALKGNQHIPARLLGLAVADGALVYLPPIISGFIGADITSGILATALDTLGGTTFFIDIGTNGEMVLNYGGELVATSTAAGPAFEGMSTSCGRRAGEGAVETFEVKSSGIPVIKTIGNVEPHGICGSGLLDVVAELVTHGIISKEGRLMQPDTNVNPLMTKLGEKEGRRAFFLTDSVYVSQKDIRQVQLAKGAIRTGIDYLLKYAGIDPHQVDRVLIAGAFGYHARIDSLVNIGLLPEEFLGKIKLVGNTSKAGGMAYLQNRASREQICSVVDRVKVIELAHCAGFDRTFAQSLAFHKGKRKQ